MTKLSEVCKVVLISVYGAIKVKEFESSLPAPSA